MIIRQPLGSEEIVVVRDEEETPGATMNLRIQSVGAKSILALSLTDLTKTRQAPEPLGHCRLDVVVEQDKRRLLWLAVSAARQRAAQARPLGLGSGSFP
jgi:hypothetical protein